MAKDYKILINGELRTTDKKLEVKSPYNGEVVSTTYIASDKDIEDALQGCDNAFKVLKVAPVWQKAKWLELTIEGMKDRFDELVETIVLDAGKPVKDAIVEVKRTIATFTLAKEESKRIYGETIPLDIFEGVEKRMGIVKRFPVGPMLGISPFNFPLNLVAHKVAPAMAVGNPIFLKPASQTPTSSCLLGEIIHDAGYPAGGVNIVPCPGAKAEKVLQDDRIKKLTFTGSPSVGWHLKALCGHRKVTLELGGNAGVIIDEGSDVELATSRCTIGAFSFAGQVCISVQRIYVHENIFEEFKNAFIPKVNALKLGDPQDETTNIGPMIDEASIEKTLSWIKEAEKEGAEILTGGEREGNILKPTVITGTVPEMKVCSEEAFAPVVVLEKFSDFDDAVASVNNSQFGLQAGVFTSDIKRAFKAFEDIEAGGIIINDIPTFRVDNMPYGGFKNSGFGREGIKYAIEEMTEIKHMALNLK